MHKTILIIDDSVSLRQVLKLTLVQAGYEILEAGNGQEALQQLDGRKIHLIVSDVNMPVMDGIAFIKAARQLPAYRFTPIIMLTTEAGADMKREGQAAGAHAWVLKPFLPSVLLKAVAKLIMP